jgi:hypothetical protein
MCSHETITIRASTTLLQEPHLVSPVESRFQPSPDLPTLTSGHVPKLNTADGVMDLFSLLNVIELSNILHPLSYAASSLRLKERLQMIEVFTLPQVFLANPHGITQNPSRKWNPILLVFWPLQSTRIHTDSVWFSLGHSECTRTIPSRNLFMRTRTGFGPCRSNSDW